MKTSRLLLAFFVNKVSKPLLLILLLLLLLPRTRVCVFFHLLLFFLNLLLCFYISNLFTKYSRANPSFHKHFYALIKREWPPSPAAAAVALVAG